MIASFASVQADFAMKMVAFASLIAYGAWTWLEPGSGSDQLGFNQRLIWWTAYLSIIVGLLRFIACRDTRETVTFRLCISALIVAAIIVMTVMLPQGGAAGYLLVFSAAPSSRLMSLPKAVLWTVAQTVIFAGMLAFFESAQTVLITVAFISLFQLGGLFSSFVAANEARVRNEMLHINCQLRETQARLAETSREAERLRIARDLHDSIGSHLTIMYVNLETLAQMIERPEQRFIVERTRAMAHELLQEVRQTVGVMRVQSQSDLMPSLRGFLERLPNLQIELQSPTSLPCANAQHMQMALRCTQELISNVVRHAKATHLWLHLEPCSAGLTIRVRDDGRGAQQLRVGNGLTGLRERIEEIGGHLRIDTAPGCGLSATVWLPRVLEAA